MSAFSPGPKTACTAKPSTGDFPINKVDPSGLQVQGEDELRMWGAALQFERIWRSVVYGAVATETVYGVAGLAFDAYELATLGRLGASTVASKTWFTPTSQPKAATTTVIAEGESEFTFTGAHVLNKGKPAGTHSQVMSIEKEGLEESTAMLGRGVYAHLLENAETYSNQPHIIFEATIKGKFELEYVTGSGGHQFVRIRTGGKDWDPVNLPIKILDARNLDLPWR